MRVKFPCLTACALTVVVLGASACTGLRVLGTPVPPRESVAVRAELASVLLNAERYDEAVREYRWLVGVDPGNREYRLSLARALAWNGQFREAEAHLRTLWARRPGDAAVDALLREVRANLTPSAAQAEGWIAERPNYGPYRLALARAFVREGRAPLSIVHYEGLLAGDPSPELRNEALAAYRAAGDRRGAIGLLQRQLRRRPRDIDVRRQLAALLADGGEISAAFAHTDTALSIERSPLLLLDRARLHLLRRDRAAAEGDLRTSLDIAPSTEAYLALGDLQRWRFDFANARLSYQYAATLSPGDPAVGEAFAQLSRDERPALASTAVPGESVSWETRFSMLRDNAGITYGRFGGGRGVRLPLGFTGTAEVEYQQLRERTPDVTLDSHGVAAEVGLARSIAHGALSAALGARAGVAQHFGEDALPLGSVAVRGGYHAWTATLELADEPAYPTLLTVASLTGAGRAGPLRERTVTVSAVGPLGAADAAVVWHRSRISDGNERTGMNLIARYRVAPRLAFLYSGASTSYLRRSQLYWDPDRYLASTLGIEISERRAEGLSYTVRALPGVARTEETPFARSPAGDEGSPGMRMQFSVGGDVAYRRDRWEVAAGVGYGRVSLYERTDAVFAVRFSP